MKTTLSLLAAAALVAVGAPAVASEYEASLQALAAEKLQSIAADPDLIAAVKAQNEAHGGLTQAEIDTLDQDWRGQVGASSAPLIDGLITSDVSQKLAAVRDDSEGLFTEIFAMDDKGLNVASSDVTSDYWQGDEAKWQDTFAVGPEAVHVSEVEFDESTQTYQSQVSLTLVDPTSSTPVGAITFGVNVEYLE